MELLREMMRLQHERGYLSDELLRDMAARNNVPLYQLEGLVSFYPAFRRTPPPKVEVHVCRDLSCRMAGAGEQLQALRQAVDGHQDVEVREVSCLGRCDSAPAAAIDDVPLPLETLASLQDVLKWRDLAANVAEVGRQRSWRCDPYQDASEQYQTIIQLAVGGSDAISACIESLLDSGLRGMGGAGFPAGRKWKMVAQQAAQPKYVICNADESEPGTFKDRLILAELPHLVIEGMLLAGLAVGAEQGIIYLRHEYAPEQRAVEAALKEARARRVLGTDAAGSGRPFDIEIFVSPGGYILGEETALLEALEDKRGEPRNKPPYPGTHGLWGKPTLINNVETFALSTAIVHHGKDWWHNQGCEGFSGLKFVCVSGDVQAPGVFEIPVGTTVADLIDLAGGMRDGQRLKAFLPGGASSKFLTAEHLQTPLDFEAVRQAGSMLGTGAVIVFAEGRDLFALATNLVRFFRNESCGKCVPCRIGTEHAVDLLQRVGEGAADPAELAVLPDLCETLEQTSICGLGQVALQPVLSMMQHFPEEVREAESL